MIKNLVDYFESSQEFYLDEVSYKRIEIRNCTESHILNCTDSIDANVNEEIVKLIVKRTLIFEPKEIFELSVAYGVVLKFKDKNKADYKWQEINLAEEFSKNGGFVLENLMGRISLLVGEITASFGQSPIILPPMLINKENIG